MNNQQAIVRWLDDGAPLLHEVNGELFDASCYYDDVIGFCGCGDPEAAATFLVNVLRNLKRDGVDQLEGLPVGLRYLVRYWIDDRGWGEHGCNISYQWLTDDGELAIRVLDAFIKLEKDDEPNLPNDAMTHEMARPREKM